MNSVFKLDEPADLLDINRIEITADTTQAHVAEAEELSGQIDRFMSDEDAWWDDVLIAEMIELAKRTGNIQRNPVKLESKVYTQGNYFTSHFGGVYVFRDANVPTIIAREPIEALENTDIEQVLSFADREGIANWLRDESLSQLIVQRPSEDSALIIRQKMDFIVVSTAGSEGHDLSGLSRQNMRSLERRYANQLPPEFTGLMEVWRWASLGGRVPRLGPAHPAFFYALRGSQNKDRDLVNMLLSDLSRLDFRQLFICHKSLFYETYQNWSESKKEFVVRFLEQEYAMDKDGAREALFGAEPSMKEEPSAASSQPIPPLRRPTMSRIVDGELLAVDVETGTIRMAAKPYVSPWGPSLRSRDKKSRKRR